MKINESEFDHFDSVFFNSIGREEDGQRMAILALERPLDARSKPP